MLAINKFKNIIIISEDGEGAQDGDGEGSEGEAKEEEEGDGEDEDDKADDVSEKSSSDGTEKFEIIN